ncbi:TLD-domain-containing protein [Rhizophagus diaphanus]|nr:TLD-domain-containing protein [Rhizophagus diaphanus] [Rhizophagus sp. MUCL 43196]
MLNNRSNYFKKAFSEQWARKEEGFFISNQPNISHTVFEVLINDLAQLGLGYNPSKRLYNIFVTSYPIFSAFSEQWARKEEGFFISNQPNISPTVFEALINLIYSETISIGSNESLVDVLIVSDELELLEIYQQLEKHLLENESAWKFPKDFITLCQHELLTDLFQFAIKLVCKDPKLIVDSKEFLNLEEQHLIQILKCDDLKLEEIEIWEYLIEWGIENTDSISNDDFTEWTPMDFSELERTLHNCIPYIRFSQMPPEVFNELENQFKSILPKDLVDDVLKYFSDPNSKPLLKNLPLRASVYPLDSKIINAKDVAVIASWIDKKKGNPYRIKDIPFKFELIYRASLERFSINKFHKCCDNKGPTVVVIKVRKSGEIIGGYNPLDWRSDHKHQASDSFLFSLFSLTNGVIPILSRISSKNEAIIWCKDKGPCFGFQDLWIRSSSRFGKSKQKSYEKKIIDSETFNIVEYEVFQVIDKRFSFFKLIKKIYDFTETVEKRFRENVRKIIHSHLALLVFIIFKFIIFGVSLLNYVLFIFLIWGILVKDIIGINLILPEKYLRAMPEQNYNI